MKHNYHELPGMAQLAVGCEPGTKWYQRSDISLRIAVSRDPFNARWHMSISHPQRNPTWEEIRDARYDLIPDRVYMVMFLPPRDEYINVHEHCFHLHEVPEDA